MHLGVGTNQISNTAPPGFKRAAVVRDEMQLTTTRYRAFIMRFLDNGNRNIELDFVRGVAILSVIGFHAITPPAQFALFRWLEAALRTIGWSGVDLFFVLSGFLIGGILLNEYKKTQALDVKRFIIRRGLKIWPAYYFYILFQVVIQRHPMKSYLLANLLHVQNYLGSSLEHTWTLSIEEHFYLLLSVAMGWMIARRWSVGKMLVTFVIILSLIFAIRCVTWYAGFKEIAEHSTHTRLDSLLFGVLLAALPQFYPEYFERIAARKKLLMLLWISAVAFIALAHERTTTAIATIGFTWIYFGYGAFMLLVYRHSGALCKLMLYRVIAKIGVYSYGIYLWHLAVRESCFHIANHFTLALRWPIAMVSEYASAIILGAILTHLIEWPALRIRDGLFPAKGRLNSMIVPQAASLAADPIA